MPLATDSEKSKHVALAPFSGQWKDLGDLNTLTDELHRPVIGNAVMGAHCKNIRVINELQT